MAKYWYSYKSSATTPQTSTSIALASNYNFVGATPPSCPGAAQKICAVYATGPNSVDTSPTAIGTHTSGYLTDAFANALNKPSNANAYVYVRT